MCYFLSGGLKGIPLFVFCILCVPNHVNRAKFERKSSLEYKDMTNVGKIRHTSKRSLLFLDKGGKFPEKLWCCVGGRV